MTLWDMLPLPVADRRSLNAGRLSLLGKIFYCKLAIHFINEGREINGNRQGTARHTRLSEV